MQIDTQYEINKVHSWLVKGVLKQCVSECVCVCVGRGAELQCTVVVLARPS